MRFFASRILLLCLLLSSVPVAAQDSFCECVICHNGQIAICHYDTGRCIGECIPGYGGAAILDFAAGFLSRVLTRNVSTQDLSTSPDEYAQILTTFINNHNGEVVIVESKRVGVGLDSAAVKALTTARDQLEGRMPTPTITIVPPTFLSRFEIAPQLSLLAVNGDSDKRINIGLGGRLSFYAYRRTRLEAMANFSLHNSKSIGSRTNGRITQMMFGSDRGLIGFGRFVVSANGQLGFVSFSGGPSNISSGKSSFTFQQERLTHLAVNFGGSLRYFPRSRDLIVRFDFGDTIIRYGRQTIAVPNSLDTLNIPGATRHNFQFTYGIGFYFK